MNVSETQVRVIDIRGRICPSTLLLALKEMNGCQDELRQGATRLRFLLDNRDSIATIPEAARNMGYEVAISKVTGYYEVVVGSVRGALCQSAGQSR